MAVRHEVPLYSKKPDFTSDRERPRLSELPSLPKISYHPTQTAYGIPETLIHFRNNAEKATVVVFARQAVTPAESAVFQAVCSGTTTVEDALTQSPFHPKYDVFEYKQTESELNAIAGVEKPIFFLGPETAHPIVYQQNKLDAAPYAPHDARAWIKKPLEEVSENMNRYFSEFAVLEQMQSSLISDQMRELPHIVPHNPENNSNEVTAALLIPHTIARGMDLLPSQKEQYTQCSYLHQAYDIALNGDRIPFQTAIRIPIELWAINQSIHRIANEETPIPDFLENIHSLIQSMDTNDIEFVYKNTADSWLSNFGLINGRRFNKAFRQVLLQQYHDVYPEQKSPTSWETGDVRGWFFRNTPPGM